MLFVLMTWIASPLFNLVLRLNRFGRLALSREQIVASNWVGACLLATIAALVARVVSGNELFLFAGLGCGAIVIPLSGTFQCSAGWPRIVMASFTAGLAAVGAAALAATAFLPADGPGGVAASVGSLLGGLFFIGAILSPWLANGLAMATPRR
jgi:hypothetical protein